MAVLVQTLVLLLAMDAFCWSIVFSKRLRRWSTTNSYVYRPGFEELAGKLTLVTALGVALALSIGIVALLLYIISIFQGS